MDFSVDIGSSSWLFFGIFFEVAINRNRFNLHVTGIVSRTRHVVNIMNDQVFEVPFLQRFLLLHSAVFHLPGVLKLVCIAGHGCLVEACRPIKHMIQWQTGKRLHLMHLVTLTHMASSPLLRPFPLLLKQMSKRSFLPLLPLLLLLFTRSDLRNFPIVLHLLEQLLLRLSEQSLVPRSDPVFIFREHLLHMFLVLPVLAFVVTPVLLFNGLVARHLLLESQFHFLLVELPEFLFFCGRGQFDSRVHAVQAGVFVVLGFHCLYLLQVLDFMQQFRGFFLFLLDLEVQVQGLFLGGFFGGLEGFFML